MDTTLLPLLSGTPDFSATTFAELASREGPEPAWRAALAGSPEPVLTRIGGAFAVALRRDDGSIVAAVDRFAMRTLCWRIVGGRLHVAERADALADRDTPIDPQAVFDYLYFHAIPSPRTVFSGVHRLPPGCCLVWSDGHANVTRYWNPVFDATRAPSFDALRDEFQQLLQVGVQRQLDGGVPACFLSGGTDSSTVAGMVGRAAGSPAHSYSIGFEAAGYDEMEYARIAARHFGTRHHEYYVTPDDLVREIPTVAAHYDQPFGNSSALPAYVCALRARQDGVSRILAGDGGDELFGGNARYAKQRVFGWYDRLPGGLRHGVLQPLFESSPARRLPLLKKGSSYVEQAKVPMPDRLDMYNLLLRIGVADVLTPAMLEQVDLQGPLQAQREVWQQCRAPDEIDRTLAYDWRYTLAENDLPKVRETTAAAGLQVGFPLLDTALVDFSLRLPAAYKLRGLKLRWFFKEALRDFLPEEIITKKKHGFGLPFGVWAVQHEGLRATAVDSLQSLAGRGIVRPEFIASLLRDRLPAHPGYYGEMVWILMMLEQWLRHHAGSYGRTA